jgi:DNA-binding NarL/FixJ family response regulator
MEYKRLVRLLIADDHPVVRDGIRFLVERQRGRFSIVAEASDGLEVLAHAQRHEVDVFLLDITMPNLNGIETARKIVEADPDARVILLTLHNNSKFVESAQKAGVRGYVVKESVSADLIRAIDAVMAGRVFHSDGLRPRECAPDTPAGQAAAGDWELTSRERQVLQLIGEGCSSKEVAAKLEISPYTVLTHRTNIMSKLGIHKDTELVRYAVKEGIAKL